MANLSKIKRDKMLAYIEKLKQEHTDDESLMMFNEIENSLTEKRYGLVFEEHTEEVDEMLRENIPVLTADSERRICKDKDLPWNFIIEGDNLQALYLLEKTHKGKVDCIYIDPPYNTGARDWKYNNNYVDENDTYRHSKWLSMMKNRLGLAKKLLNPTNSVLICTIDEKEYLHLGCLLEEMFPEANIQMISTVINPHGANRKNLFARVDEYIYFVLLGNAHVVQGQNDMLNPVDEKKRDTWARLLRGGASGLRTSTPNQFYPIFFRISDGKYMGIGDVVPLGIPKETVIPPEECFAFFPVGDDGKERCWGLTTPSFLDKMEKGYIKFGPYKQGREYRALYHLQSGTIKAIENGDMEVYGKNEDGTLIVGSLDKPKRPVSVWMQATHDSRVHGAMMLNRFFPEIRFQYPKSLYAVIDTLRFFLAKKQEAVIVDFFAGSGTTQHAVNLLNKEDGGHRVCIMVTNNEISEKEEKEFKKTYPTCVDKDGKIIRDCNEFKEYQERLGIATHVTWPRTECSIKGCDTNGKPLSGDYIITDDDNNPIPMSQGFNSNVKFFRCNWVSREIGDGNLTDVLMQHIVEMIELENSIEIDGTNYLIVLSEEQADKLETQWNADGKIKGIYISRNVLLTTKQNVLFNTVPVYTIPDYYFDIEMKEVGETW